MKVINKKSNLFIMTMFIGTAIYLASPLFFRDRSNLNFMYSINTDTFMDFFNTNKYVSNLDPYYYGPHGNYPPLAYLMIYPFSKFYNYIEMSPFEARTNQLAIMSFVVFCIFSFVVLGLIIYDKLNIVPNYKRFLLIILLVLSAPSIFLIERGNYLIIALITLTLFVYNYNNTNKLVRELSLISLAISISFKIYPAIFILLLIDNKHWKDIARLFLYLVIMFIIPSLFFQGGIIQTTRSFIQNLLLQVQYYGSDDIAATAYRINFSAFTRMLTIVFYKGNSIPVYKTLGLCFTLGYTAFGIWAFFLSKVFWKKILILASLMVLIPSVSGLYNITFYFIPFVLYLIDDDNSNINYIYSILFAGLFLSKQYFVIFDYPYNLDSNTFLTNIVAIYLLTVLTVDCISHQVFKHTHKSSQIQHC